MRSQGIAQGTTPTLTGSVLPRAIVDNSVWQRAHLLDVKVALTELFQAGYEVVTCAAQLLEVLWSARSGADHRGSRPPSVAFRPSIPSQDLLAAAPAHKGTSGHTAWCAPSAAPIFRSR